VDGETDYWLVDFKIIQQIKAKDMLQPGNTMTNAK